MFERFKNPAQFKRMLLAHRLHVREPVGSLFGWEVWAMDGKAYLFRKDRKHCLVADWFEFCRGLRWLGVTK
jgi:hypothetical protein